MELSQTTASPPGLTLLIGAGGGIGAALHQRLEERGDTVIALGRHTEPALDYSDEASVAACAEYVTDRLDSSGRVLNRLIVATGFLHGSTPSGHQAEPERSWKHLDPEALAHSFLVNAIGPALVIKHLLPLLPRQGRCVAALVS